MKFIGTVAVLGTGLLGASLAKALKKLPNAPRVAAWSRGASTRAKCRALPEVFDEVFDSPEEAAASADVVVICSPTANIPEIAAKIAPAMKGGAAMTDVGSVKGAICAKCAEIAAAENRSREESGRGGKIFFAGSHPMAGSEKIGIDFSDADLFKTRPCFVVPTAACGSGQIELLRAMWESVGMRVYEVSPEEHDAIVAGVSHLPHLVAGALCNTAAGFPSGDLRKYAGPGFRDCTRVSSGNPEIWDSIVADNRDAILAALRNFSGELSELVSALERRDFAKIGEKLRSAKAYRDKL